MPTTSPYAKAHVHPVLSEEASQLLIEHYVQTRERGKNANTIQATTRQLESFIRLSEALAKMRLDEVVTVAHVQEAHRLWMSAAQMTAIDPKTGRIDMDLIHTGRSASDRSLQTALKKEVLELVRRMCRGQDSVKFMALFEDFQAKSPTVCPPFMHNAAHTGPAGVGDPVPADAHGARRGGRARV